MNRFFIVLGVYLCGYILAYPCCRIMDKLEDKDATWTIADRKLALKLSFMSWVVILIAVFCGIGELLKLLGRKAKYLITEGKKDDDKASW